MNQTREFLSNSLQKIYVDLFLFIFFFRMNSNVENIGGDIEQNFSLIKLLLTGINDCNTWIGNHNSNENYTCGMSPCCQNKSISLNEMH